LAFLRRASSPRWHGHTWIACMEACTLLQEAWVEGVVMQVWWTWRNTLLWRSVGALWRITIHISLNAHSCLGALLVDHITLEFDIYPLLKL
jgi:hypothetical protein